MNTKRGMLLVVLVVLNIFMIDGAERMENKGK